MSTGASYPKGEKRGRPARPSITRLATRLLLFLFPPSFRKEYGREWEDLAREGLERTRRKTGRRLVLPYLWTLLLDTLRSAPGLWLRAQPPKPPHRQRGAGAAESLVQDLGFGLRTLRKRPLFTLLSVGILGVGIGASTAIFSVVDAVLLCPPPYERPEELVSVWQTYPEWRDEPMLAQMWDWGFLSYPGYQRWREGQTHFQDVAIHAATARNLSGQGEPERLLVGVASSSLFSLLGVRPSLGRTFLPTEDMEGGPRVVVLSDSFWRERFGGDPDVLGRTVTLDQGPFTVVGVLPREFRLRGLGPMGSDGDKPIWIPLGADGLRRGDNAHSYEALARLNPGASLAQAIPEARNLIGAPGEEPGHGVRMVPWAELESQGLQPPLLLLLGASLVLLLIASGNVATLLLGEVDGRRHEIATRTALGAGRGRLCRQLLTESGLLALAGTLVGVGIALAGTRTLLATAPPIPGLDQVGMNGPVLGFAVGVGLATGILFGMTPAWSLAGSGLGPFLGSGRRTGGKGPTRFQGVVVAGELALTMVLLVSGVLLARSLVALMSVDTGFRGEGVAMVRVYFPGYRYADPVDRATQAERIRVSLAAVPGVLAASGTTSLPFYNAPSALSYGIEGREMPEELSPHTSLRNVLPGFFETMGIRILEGRALEPTDRLGSTPVAVISETMARRHWPQDSPIGARILFGDTLEVVGVCADVVHESLDAEPLATLYVPFLMESASSINFVVRTAGDPTTLLPAFRQAVWEVDPEAPVSRVTTLPSLIRDSARGESFRTLLILVFAGCATLLAGAGVFGVTARNVAQRIREMGIRKAVGATPGGLVRLALFGTARIGLLGIGAGLLGAFWATRLLGRFLYGVAPWDPLTYFCVAGGLLILSLLASYLPARRAGRVPAMEVLRGE